jgi:hypothetical protein
MGLQPPLLRITDRARLRVAASGLLVSSDKLRQASELVPKGLRQASEPNHTAALGAELDDERGAGRGPSRSATVSAPNCLHESSLWVKH